MKTILISGGEGQFAKAINKVNKKYKIYVPSKKVMDISNLKSIEKYIKNKNIDYFIHAAAFSTPMSDHKKKVKKSIMTNIIGSANVAICCFQKNIKLIYISTNFVYEGKKGNYSETDNLLPVNEYGWSKLGGECASHIYKNSLILRICMNNDQFPHKSAFTNYVTSFLKKTEAAKITLRLLNKFGVINVGGKKQSAYNFAKNLNVKIKKSKLSKSNLISLGKNTSLNLSKLNNILKNGKN